MQEQAPGGLDTGVRVRGEALVGEEAKLVERLMLATRHHQVEALAVDGEQVALRLRVHGCLLRSAAEAGTLAEDVAFGEKSDRHHADGLLDHDAASAPLDEEDGVALLALVQNHVAGVELEAPRPPRQRAHGRVLKAEEDGREFDGADARDHVVERQRRAVGPLLHRSVPAEVGGEHRSSRQWSFEAGARRAWSHRDRLSPCRYPARKSQRACACRGPTVGGNDVTGHEGSGCGSFVL